MEHKQIARDLYNQVKGMVATTKTFKDIEKLKVEELYTFNKTDYSIDLQYKDLVVTARKENGGIYLENIVEYYINKDTWELEVYTF